jgi:hypothetical protein
MNMYLARISRVRALRVLQKLRSAKDSGIAIE